MLKTGAEALGSPGIDPRWARGDKDGIGTAYRSSSRVWFSIWNGILTEVYYPHVDKPQIRELIFSFTDGSTFFIDESSLNHRIERITEYSPSYRIISEDQNRRFTLIKEIITDNYAPSVIINVKILHGENWNDAISSYFTIYPHIDGEGKNNHGYILHRNFDRIFIAERNGTYMAVKASSQFVKSSVGYVGRSDGFTDLKETFNLSREFDNASSGNIAFTAKVLLQQETGTTIILSFGNSQPTALSRLYQSLSVPFDFHLERFTASWKRKLESILDLGKHSKDGGNLYRMSYSLIMSHEDKTHEGGIIASLSIPWGELSDDSNKGGYHLVWSRDLVNAATGLLAAGDLETPLRSLIYLSANQREDGSFPQNFWVSGEPYWNAVQLDQTAFPIKWKGLSSMNLKGLPCSTCLTCLFIFHISWLKRAFLFVIYRDFTSSISSNTLLSDIDLKSFIYSEWAQTRGVADPVFLPRKRCFSGMSSRSQTCSGSISVSDASLSIASTNDETSCPAASS